MTQSPAPFPPSRSKKPRRAGRWLLEIYFALFLLATAVVVVAVSYFAQREDLRVRFDATKTRAYSLSQQTRQMLAELEGQWQIALVYAEDSVDRATRRQISEVLKQFTNAAPNIAVAHIDPTDVRMLDEYDALLARLQAVYRQPVQQYEQAIDAGVVAYEQLQLLAQQHAAALEEIVARLPADDPTGAKLQPHAGLMAVLAEQGELVTAEVAKARKVDQGQPIPDYETARSILASGLSQWALGLDDLAALLSSVRGRGDVDPIIRQLASRGVQEYQRNSLALAEAADALKRLPPMELSAIGQQLRQGEAAVIIGPDRAAVIPSSQLLPKSNIQVKADGGVSFDQRFRGEQLIAAAIRSLIVEHLPRVVFVHAEEGSLLQQRDRQADLVGVTAMLRASRFDVTEWAVAKQPQRPELPNKGQPVVWVVVPPAPARSIEPTPAIQALTQAVEQLIASGEPVLLSVYPSLMAKYGQPDPLAALAAPFGIKADTAHIILELASAGEARGQVSTGQTVIEVAQEHPIARTISGQQTYFPMPVPVMAIQSQSSVNSASQRNLAVVVQIEPKDTRWLEPDWTRNLTNRTEVPEAHKLTEPVAIAMAAERPHPVGKGVQRFLMVGSGGWMITNVSDPIVDLGGGRAALLNPGNHELMLSAVAWLAGMDDLIAAGPVGQEVGRLQSIPPHERLMWRWIIIAGLPAACLLLGVIMAVIRRI